MAIVAIACLSALLFVRVALAEDWPQFRGPNATGISTESKNLPVEFSYKRHVKWSTEIGRGVASSTVAAGRVFAGGMVDEEKFAVFAFDAASGEQLWRREFDTGPLPEIIPPNEHASSTPASDGRRVYVYFSTLGILALDASDGRLLWQHKLPVPFYLMGWGPANSPIVYEDRVVFNLDDDLAAYLLALDKHTGEVRWKTPRPEMLGGYATPVLSRVGNRTDIVVAGTGKLKGYDPQTGEERWTCNSLLRTIMTTPVVRGDTIYLSVESYGDTDRVLRYALLQWRDTNQDGKLEKKELEEAFWDKFEQGDHDKDGFLVDAEIDAAFQAPTNMIGGGNIIQAIRGGGKGDVTETHLLWNLNNRSPSNIASPLVLEDRLFVVKKGGISAAFDIQDGSTLWQKKRIGNFGNYYASPVAGDGKIYVTGENGFIVVMQAGPKPVILAKNDMGDSCTATPAIADDRIYIRTLNKLFCISNEVE